MLLRHTSSKLIGLLASAVLLIVLFLCSIVYGYTDTSWRTALEAYTQFDGSNDHIVIRELRMPRAVIAVLVGGSLAIAGTLMQALTRNPLASPDIFGVNAGASLFIVFAVSVLSITALSQFVWFAFIGAALAALLVYFISSLGRDGVTPVKLVLAGAAISVFFSSLTSGLLIIDEGALDQVLFWLAGSVQGRNMEVVYPVLPFIAFGWLVSYFIAVPMNTLTMGDDIAKGLGQKVVMVKAFAALIIVLLSGASVAMAGPIGFIGLVIPHIARGLVGPDNRWVLPYSALLGGVLLLAADIGARFIIFPKEVPVGVMTAVVGAPFFIVIARRGLRKS